jgi:TolA-binding protein
VSVGATTGRGTIPDPTRPIEAGQVGALAPPSRPARSVPGLADTYAATNGLFAAGRYCDAQPVLDYFAGLARTDRTAAVVVAANLDRRTGMYECGLAEYGSSDYAGAKDRLPAFIAAYPDDARVAQARSAIVAATVLAESGEAPLPLALVLLRGLRTSPARVQLTAAR